MVEIMEVVSFRPEFNISVKELEQLNAQRSEDVQENKK